MQLEEFLRWREITERSEVEKTVSPDMGSNKLSTHYIISIRLVSYHWERMERPLPFNTDWVK